MITPETPRRNGEVFVNDSNGQSRVRQSWDGRRLRGCLGDRIDNCCRTFKTKDVTGEDHEPRNGHRRNLLQSEDPDALGAWYRDHRGLAVADWGGAIFNWGGRAARRA